MKSSIFQMLLETEAEVLSFEGKTLAQLSAAWSSHRDQTGIGASEIIDGGDIHANGKFAGHMSYNGKVWPSRRWNPGDKPIYEP